MKKDNKLEYGFWDGCTVYTLGSKNDMISFFDIIEKYCDVEGKELVTRELKIRYIKYEDVYELDRVFKEIAQCFSRLKTSHLKELERYKKNSFLDWNQETIYQVFKKFIENSLEASEGLIWSVNNETEDELTFFTQMKVILTDIGYSYWIKELPQELFDNLTDEDEPFWMWDIDKLEALVKQQNPAYKDVHHAVYVLADK